MKFKIKVEGPVMVWSGEDADVIFDMHYYGNQGIFKVVDKKKLLSLGIMDLKEILEFIKNKHPKQYKTLTNELKIVNKDIYTNVTVKVNGDTPEINKIKSIMKNHNGKPYIPGSSLKGAIVSSFYWEYLLKKHQPSGNNFPVSLYDGYYRDGQVRLLSCRDKLIVRDSKEFNTWEVGSYKKVNGKKKRLDGGFYTEFLPPGETTTVEISKGEKVKATWQDPAEAEGIEDVEKELQRRSLKDVLKEVDDFSRRIINYRIQKLSKVSGTEKEFNDAVKQAKEELDAILNSKEEGYLVLIGANKLQLPDELRLQYEEFIIKELEKKNPRNRKNHKKPCFPKGLSTILTVLDLGSSNYMPIGIVRLIPEKDES